MDGYWPFLFLALTGLYLFTFAWSEGDAFSRVQAEFAEADGPEWINCVPPATSVACGFVIDLGEFATFGTLPVYAWVRVVLILLVVLPLGIGIAGTFL